MPVCFYSFENSPFDRTVKNPGVNKGKGRGVTKPPVRKRRNR